MKNILFVLTLCEIFILSACQEAPPAETPELSTNQRFEPGVLIEWDDEVPQELIDFMDLSVPQLC